MIKIEPIDNKISDELLSYITYQDLLYEQLVRMLMISPSGGTVDTLVSKTSAERREGSNPSLETTTE